MRHSKLDWILVVCFGALALWSGYKLYSPSSSNDFDANSFARLESLTNVVKSKSLGELGWGDARTGQGFRRKDQIYTYQDSKAVLSLADGQNLTVLPNTLIELDQAQGTFALQVKEGLVYLDVKQGKELALNLDGQSVKIKGDNARVKLSKTGDKVRLESSGAVEVSRAGSKVALDQNSSVEIASNQELKVSKLDIILLTPRDAEVLWTTSGDLLPNFSWQGNQSFKVQIDRNPSFSNPTSAQNLSEGSYFWRVVDGKNQARSGIQTFDIRNFSTPWFIITADTPSELILEDELVEMELEWQHPYVEEFELRISHNDEEQIIPLQSRKRRLEFSRTGQWLVSVRAIGEIKSQWSVPHKVLVRSPTPIELIGPAADAEIALAAPGESIELKFVGPGQVEVARDEAFERVVFSKEASDQVSWQVEEAGVYYWRVRQERRFSPTRRFEVRPGAPLPAPEFKRAPSEIKLKVIKPTSWLAPLLESAYAQDFAADFEWQAVSGAIAYRLDIYSDANAETLVKSVNVTENSYRWIGAPLRTIWWRVTAIDAWKRPGLPSSLVTTKLTAPSGWEETEVALNSPAHGVELETKTPTRFEWDESPGVKQWQWLLSEDLSFTKPVLTKSTNQESIEISELPAGIWYWRVRAKDSLGRVVESRRRRIHVSAPDPVLVAKRVKRVESYQLRLKLRSPFDIELGLLAAKPSYELTRGSQKFTLSGFTASGVHLNLSREWGQWRGLLDVDYSAGKAFESLGYKDAKLTLAAEKPWDLNFDFPLWTGGGIYYSQLSSYVRASNSNKLSEESLSNIGVVAFVNAEPIKWASSYLHVSAFIAGPGRMTLGAELKHVLGNWYWGVGFERSSLEDNGEISVSSLMLNLGYRWQRNKN